MRPLVPSKASYLISSVSLKSMLSIKQRRLSGSIIQVIVWKLMHADWIFSGVTVSPSAADTGADYTAMSPLCCHNLTIKCGAKRVST